jgi:catechol 2,3-dioxygenase-like lactoylglutathione lyase family enzyme
MTSRHIDHLVIAVRDLDGAARLYERLGFVVGGRNRHPWGTENRLVQFGRSYLELIAIGEGAEIPPHAPRAFSFGAFVRDYLARREGLAMLALSTDDARGDATSLAQAGIGGFEPFHFSRRGRRPDGSDAEVAFTLAFARDAAAPDAGFFVCQHHRPENFWDDARQTTSMEPRPSPPWCSPPSGRRGIGISSNGSPARRRRVPLGTTSP